MLSRELKRSFKKLISFDKTYGRETFFREIPMKYVYNGRFSSEEYCSDLAWLIEEKSFILKSMFWALLFNNHGKYGKAQFSKTTTSTLPGLSSHGKAVTISARALYTNQIKHNDSK